MGAAHDPAADLCTAAGLGLGQLGAYDEALPYAQRAVDITADLHGPNDRHTLQRRSNVGQLLKSRGDREAAIAVYREVLEAQETHLGREDIDVAATINNMGVLLWREDLHHEMLSLYRRALRIRERIWSKTGHRDSEKRWHAYKLAESHSNMGALMIDLGRPRQAGPNLDKALNIMTGEFGLNHERNANTLVLRGSALRALNLYPEALKSMESALDIYSNVTRGVSEDAGRAMANLGSIFAELAEDDGVYEWQRAPLREMARNWLQTALTGSQGGYGEEHPVTGGLHRALGEVRETQGAYGDAQSHLEHAESCRGSNLRVADAEAATAINRAGRSLVEWGLYNEAQTYLEHALEIRVDVLEERSFVTSNSLFNLGTLFQLRGWNEQAREMLQRALDIRCGVCGETHPATKLVRENLHLLDG